jgi:hypothetical protein
LTNANNGERSIPALTGQIPSASYNDVTTSRSATSSCIALSQNEYVTTEQQPSAESMNLAQLSAAVPALCQLTVPSPGASKVKVNGTPQLPVIMPGLSVKMPGDDAPRQIVAKELGSLGFTVVSPNSKRVLLVKPAVSVPRDNPSIKFAPTGDTARPGCRLVLQEKQLIRTPLTTSGQIVARPLLPKGLILNHSTPGPVSTGLGPPANKQPAQPPPRLIVRTKMLIFNRPLAPKIDIPFAVNSPNVSSAHQTERESPLSCLEQLVANAAADVSKAISDVEFGTDETPMSNSCSSLAEFNTNVNNAKLSPRTPLDLTLKPARFQNECFENMHLRDKSNAASKFHNDGCSQSKESDELSQIQNSGGSDETDRISTILNETSDCHCTESDDSVYSRPAIDSNSATSVSTVIGDCAGEGGPSRSLEVSSEASLGTAGGGYGEFDSILNPSSSQAEMDDSERWCKALNLRRRGPNQLTDAGRYKKLKQF